MNAVSAFDTFAESAIAPMRTSHTDTFFYYITMLGNVEVAIVLSAICAWWALRHHQWRNHALLFLLAASGTVAAKEAIKMIVMRPRPEAIPIARGLESSFSFPSGHATFITAAMTIAAYTLTKRYAGTTQKVLIYSVSAAVVLLVAYSRLHLRVHYASDVVAGIVLGFVGSLIAIHLIIKKHAA